MSIIIKGQTNWAHGQLATGSSVIYDPFEYTAGSAILQDLSGNNNTASIDSTKVTKLSNGLKGFSFTGGSPYFTGKKDSIVTTTGGSFTIQWWNKGITPTTVGGTLSGNIAVGSTTPLLTCIFQYTSNIWTLKTTTNSASTTTYINTTPAITDTGSWHNYALTVDQTSGTMKTTLYFNGSGSIKTAASNFGVKVPDVGISTIYVNARTLGSIQAYKRALSPTEIMQNYNVQKYRFIN